MKYLFVGLGNIGKEYENTRHNIGFATVDALAKEQEANFIKGKLGSLASFKYKARHIHLLKPSTYMNLSGNAVHYYMKHLKVPISSIAIITDDINLPTGKLRLRAKGGNGGHNGLKNIEEKLHTTQYIRLRFGVDKNFRPGKQADYVLSPFDTAVQVLLEQSIVKAGKLLLSLATKGLSLTMNEYNKP